MSCSSHSPPASHTGQSSGWFPSSSLQRRLARLLDLSASRSRPPCPRRPASCMPSAASASSQSAPRTCGTPPAATAPGSSRMPESRSPPCAGVDQQRPRRCGDLLAVDSKRYISHISSVLRSPYTSAGSATFGDTGRVCPPGDPQIPCGTSSQTRSSASPPHRPAGRTSAPSCSPPGTGCCRCPWPRRRPRETASASSSASPCLRGRECTTRSSRADKTCIVRSANSTMQTVSSSTTTPPEPSMLPALAIWSKSMPMSISSGSRHGVDDPPAPPPSNLVRRESRRHLVNHLLQVVAHRQLIHARPLDVARSSRTAASRRCVPCPASRTPRRLPAERAAPSPASPRC